MSLPAADDLFRPTGDPGEVPPAPPSVRVVPDAPAESETPSAAAATEVSGPSAAAGAPTELVAEARKGASGRIRHDEKMTVYVTTDELMDIERARLDLRGRHGLAVDRGRLVREAVALVLGDLDRQGTDSLLVRRLTGE